MIGVDAVMTTFAPSTASSSTRTPSTRMQRLPMNAPSSMMFGRAPGGSSTPPIPTPPARCTFWPTCAHEPTVAQVSTIEFAPTRAPMFTKPGMSTAPGSRNEPKRATPPGTSAHARLLEVALQRDLVARLERPELLGLHPGDAEVQVHRLHEPGVHLPLAVHLLRDAQLATVEAVQRLHDGGAVEGIGELLPVPEGRRDAPPRCRSSRSCPHPSPCLDGLLALLERRHERHAHVASPAPNAVPGATTIPSSSSLSACDAAVSPPGTLTHR